jgi:hypothetical protein
MRNVIDAHRDDWDDTDDHVGGVFEYRWSAEALKRAQSGQPTALIQQVQDFSTWEGNPRYTLTFVLE